MWSEVRPEFVKIDQHFIRRIADDPLKFRLVEAIRDLGIHCGQGFLIARPISVPPTRPSAEIVNLLSCSGIIISPRNNHHTGASARQLLQIVDPVLPTMLNEHVFDRFELQSPDAITRYHAEDRCGNQILHPLPCLSIGALVVDPEQFHSHHEMAGAMGNAKKEAKKILGSALFVERRS